MRLPLSFHQVMHKATRTIYAMKVMRKERILQRDHSEYVRSERDLLTAVVHPYIVTLRFSFQVGARGGVRGAGHEWGGMGNEDVCGSTGERGWA